MAFYVPIGIRGLIFRLGLKWLRGPAGWAYRRDLARRRKLALDSVRAIK